MVDLSQTVLVSLNSLLQWLGRYHGCIIINYTGYFYREDKLGGI